MPTAASERARLAAAIDVDIAEDPAAGIAIGRPIDVAHRLLQSREAWAVKRITRWADDGTLEAVRVGPRRDRMITWRSADALQARWADEVRANASDAS